MSLISLAAAFNDFEHLIDDMGLDKSDEIALSEAWNDHTDALCKDGSLTDLQYHYCPAYGESMPNDDIEFILEEMGVTATFTKIAQRSVNLDWAKDSRHYAVNIAYKGKSMDIEYSYGSACGEPTVKGVIEGLTFDTESSGYTFDDFCDEYGYDTDSRRDYATWELLEKQSKEFKELFSKIEIEQFSEMFSDL